MNLLNLFATLTLDKSSYDKGITEASTQGNNFASDLQSKVSPKAVAAFMAIATAVVGVSKEIYKLAMQTMEYSDQIGDLAAKFGVTSEAISEMQYIASQTGSDIGTLTSSMSMLYMRAKEDGDAFKELGVSVKDSQGNFKAMDELFWETVEAMNSLESEGEKSAYMLDLFGRSASQIGELLRKDTEEINAMRQEVRDLGIVLNEQTTDFAGGFFDKIDQMKLQGQSALASLIAGEDDAEEKLQRFFDTVFEMLDEYLPSFVNFGIKLILQVAIGIIRIMPSLIVEIFGTIVETLLNLDWFQLGVDIAKAILEGFINLFVSTLNNIFGGLGLDIPKVNFGVGEQVFNPTSETGGDYAISHDVNNNIKIEIDANGDTPISKENAEKTAEALAPYIDKILGGR